MSASTVPERVYTTADKAERCPRCHSQHPHLHPAVAFEGEVSICPDPFHRTVTPQNTRERIAKTEALRERIAAA